MVGGLHGAHGVRVLSHVIKDKSHDQDHAPRHPQPTVDEDVLDPVPKAPPAQVDLVLYLLIGVRGLCGVRVLAHVVPDNLHERELASIHKTLDNPAQEKAPKQGAARLT